MSQILSTAEAAKILDVSQRTVINMLNRGELKGQQLDQEWAVDAQSVLGYKARKEAEKKRQNKK